MGRVARLQQQARAVARVRRIALDHERATRDQRVEAAAAAAILALGEREQAQGQVRAAETRVGYALRAILAEGVKVDGVARLCDLSAAEVRRLRRSAQAAQDLRADPPADGPALDGSLPWRPAAPSWHAAPAQPGASGPLR